MSSTTRNVRAVVAHTRYSESSGLQQERCFISPGEGDRLLISSRTDSNTWLTVSQPATQRKRIMVNAARKTRTAKQDSAETAPTEAPRQRTDPLEAARAKLKYAEEQAKIRLAKKYERLTEQANAAAVRRNKITEQIVAIEAELSSIKAELNELSPEVISDEPADPPVEDVPVEDEGTKESVTE